MARSRGTVGAEIARGAAGVLALKVGSQGLKFITGVFLARLLGAEGLGVYSFALALIALLQVPQLGVYGFVVKEVAALRERQMWGSIRGLLTRAHQAVLLTSAGVTVIAAVVVWGLLGGTDSPRTAALMVALPLVPVMGLSTLRSASLNGLRHVVLAQLPDLLVYPLALALFILGAHLLLPSGFPGPTGAVGLNVAATLVGLAVGAALLVRRLPAQVRESVPEYHGRDWIHGAIPFILLSGLTVVNDRLSVVMVGLFMADADVGVYQTCILAAAPIVFGLQAANTAVAPHIVSLWVRRDISTMQRVVTGAARAGLAVALPATIVLVTMGGFLLAVVFGEEFRAGGTAIALLAVGQLINAFFGPVGLIVNLTGHTALAVRAFVLVVVANVALHALLVPRAGIAGAAIATVLVFILWNAILFHYVRRRVGVSSTALGSR